MKQKPVYAKSNLARATVGLHRLPVDVDTTQLTAVLRLFFLVLVLFLLGAMSRHRSASARDDGERKSHTVPKAGASAADAWVRSLPGSAALIRQARVRSLTGHSKKVQSVAWNCSGSTLASGSLDTTTRLWSVDSAGHVRIAAGWGCWRVFICCDDTGEGNSHFERTFGKR